MKGRSSGRRRQPWASGSHGRSLRGGGPRSGEKLMEESPVERGLEAGRPVRMPRQEHSSENMGAWTGGDGAGRGLLQDLGWVGGELNVSLSNAKVLAR